jgi:hypothetical protein
LDEVKKTIFQEISTKNPMLDHPRIQWVLDLLPYEEWLLGQHFLASFSV